MRSPAPRGKHESTASRIDVVYYDEGHPDNNHRDGYALQWARSWREGELLSGEFGIAFLRMDDRDLFLAGVRKQF